MSVYENSQDLFSHVHLQWFAPEDEGRTEEPTEYKLRKAREEGQVAKSQDLTGSIVLLFTSITLALFAPSMLATIRSMFRWFITESITLDITTSGNYVFMVFLDYVIRLVFPIALVSVVAALGANLLQVGFLFTTKPLRPDLKRIVPNFIKYFQRTLFSTDGLYNIAKSIGKVIILIVLVYLNVQADIPRLLKLQTATIWVSFQFIAALALRVLLEASVILLVLALLDYLVQRRQFRKQMRMTKQEIKEEYKMMEGDPLVRSKLRERMRELLTRNMIANVPKADVVITNPTHYAVAIEWDRTKMIAPMVVAKGVDRIALEIRRIAEENKVPIVENRPLARALYAETEVGDIIPEQHWNAIATVLAYIVKTSERARERFLGTGTER
ncbi:MAG TPA: flagellar biosynthesis protein FlhB [Spirochaetia bacterium]|nr:flagellar biosynthesis protein FlhB [Spirochaetales bacterium]HPD79679.1 flagellar biosynthesis protein FlhB [Spirochaetales bacterium]HRS64982.1 flagellar biosynthesis protein FlhB [Spirochaetia bacterium]HRV27436.1 flagellar biosynthesis protein FlhB [Spirochaetia bacterium]